MPDRYTGFLSHSPGVTSANTTDTQTVTQPTASSDIFPRGFYVTVSTTSCYMTFDASTPTSTNGLTVPAGTAPIFFPFAPATITVRSSASANSIVNVTWVSS